MIGIQVLVFKCDYVISDTNSCHGSDIKENDIFDP